MLPGALGLFLAAMLAAVMSSCDAYMLSSAALFTQNIYRPLRAHKEEAHYLRVGRITGVIVVCCGIAFAFWVPNVIKALEIWFMIAPMMGIAFWLGLLWRRLTVAGAWASTLTGFLVWFLMSRPGVVGAVAGLPFADRLRLIWLEKGVEVIHLPWQIVAYMSTAVAAGVLVSLCTRPVPEEKLRRFYDLTRTPIQPDEELRESCRLPDGVLPASRRMLVEAFGLEIPLPSATSLWGFGLGWLMVVLMIAGFAWLWA